MSGEDVTVAVVAASASASAPNPSVTMTAYLFLDWFEIAIRHEHEAKVARKSNGQERQEAMIAVTASAHALDGLAYELEEHLDPHKLATIAQEERKEGAGRAGQINAIFMLAFGVERDDLRDQLITLMKTLRDPAVHPKAAEAAPVRHPDASRAENVAVESALYSVEGAHASVDLVCDVTRRVPSAESDAAGAVARATAPRIGQLLAERERLIREERQEDRAVGQPSLKDSGTGVQSLAT